MQNNRAKGDAVYDPFLGSGTTLIAAETIERVCLGLDLDPRKFDRYERRAVSRRERAIRDFLAIKWSLHKSI
jgi:DNA modification methylase